MVTLKVTSQCCITENITDQREVMQLLREVGREERGERRGEREVGKETRREK